MAICPQCGNTQPDNLSFCPNDGSPLVLSQAPAITDVFPAGTVISDRYRLIAPIAVGGMGAVYRAEHTLMQRRIAVKLLRPELADRDEARKRFIREAQLCAQLDHPNCVTVYDFGTIGEDVFFLAMEFLEGKTMADILRDNGPMPAKHATEIICQVLDALGAAHAVGIVHRDVKPANIMILNHPDGTERAKLLDFGIAKAPSKPIEEDASEHHVATPITLHGLTVGTPEYIAPEQALGRPADGRADLYSLAVSLFEILTGKLPFFSNSPVAIVTSHVNDPPPKPSQMARPDMPISAALDAVILKGLAKRAEDRFMDAAEFRQELLEAVPDAVPTEVSVRRRLPTGETPSSNSPAVKPGSGVINLPSQAAAAPIKPLGALPTVQPDGDPFASWQQLSAVEMPEDRPKPSSKKSGVGTVLGLSLGLLLLGGGVVWALTQLNKQNPTSKPTSTPISESIPAIDLSPIEGLLKKQDFPGAIKALEPIVAKEPKLPRAQLLLGHANYNLPDMQAAQRAYFKATVLDSSFCVDKSLVFSCIEMLNDKDAKIREGARDIFVSCGAPVAPALALTVNTDDRKRVKQESLMALEKMELREINMIPIYLEGLASATSCENRLIWVKQLRATKDKEALKAVVAQESTPDSKCLKSEISAAKKELDK